MELFSFVILTSIRPILPLFSVNPLKSLWISELPIWRIICEISKCRGILTSPDAYHPDGIFFKIFIVVIDMFSRLFITSRYGSM